MSGIPPPLLEYLYDLIIKDRNPGFLFIEKDGCIKSWGGKLDFYGITGLKAGNSAEEHILFLQGFFPLDDEPMNLSCVQTDSGVSADVHIFPKDAAFWLVLLDATVRESEITVLQQEVNELRLFRDKQTKLLEQYFGQKDGEKIARFIIGEEGECKYMSVLFADIRCFTTMTKDLSCAEILNLLDLYMDPIVHSVIDEGGLVDKIVGDQLMGIFGILPSGLSPCLQSVRAALRMMERINILKKERQGKIAFDIGIGIASGQAAIGLIGSWDRRKILSTIGFSVNLAAHLEKHAQPNQILIDENTYEQIAEFQAGFSSLRCDLKNNESVQAFSCEFQI